MFSRRKKSASTAPTMRGMEIVRDGGENILQQSLLPVPVAGPGEALIRTAYAGINRADLMQLAGNYPPPEGASPLPGLEISGTIVGLGEGVIGWNAGEEVCALLAGGGYAEYAVVPAGQVLTIPKRMSLKEAATLPEAAATAYMALGIEAKLQPSERVLIHGGSSGVGLMLAQVARAWKGQVYATAGGEKKCEFVQALGVTAIDHSKAPFEQQVMEATNNEGVDVIVDILGGPSLASHLKLLRPRGRLIVLALLEGSAAESVKLGGVLMKNLTIKGTTLRNKTLPEKAAIIDGVRRKIWPHISTGAIRPFVDSVFPLNEAEKAFARMQERLHCGKILLEVAAHTQ